MLRHAQSQNKPSGGIVGAVALAILLAFFAILPRGGLSLSGAFEALGKGGDGPSNRAADLSGLVRSEERRVGKEC